MSTVQDVFDRAVFLLDEQNEATGSTDTADTAPYRLRAVSLCNTLLGFVYPASDTFRVTQAGRRPVCRPAETPESTLAVDEQLCTSVLPWGMAALFVLDDDREKADFFWTTFLERIEASRRGIPCAVEAVEDVYGALGHGQDGAWL